MHKFIGCTSSSDLTICLIRYFSCHVFCLKWIVEFVGQNFVLGKRCMLIFNACLMFLCLLRSRDAMMAVLVVNFFCVNFFIVVGIFEPRSEKTGLRGF